MEENLMPPDSRHLDPQRLPSWRSDRVMALLSGGDRPQRASPRDDNFVRSYLRLLRDYQLAVARGREEVARSRGSLEDAPSIMRLFGRHYGPWYAHRIHYDPDGEWRALWQARILARDSDDEIAARFGTKPAVAFWYEKLYFDVRDRLDRPDWVLKTILEMSSAKSSTGDGGGSEARRDLIYQYFAYCGGSHALDAVFSGFPAGVPARKADMASWFDSVFKHKVKVRAATALSTLKSNKLSLLQLLKLGLGVLDINNRAGEDEQWRSSLKAAVADLMKELRREQRVRQKTSQTSERHYQGAVELQTKEEMLMAAGQASPDLLHELQEGGDY